LHGRRIHVEADSAFRVDLDGEQPGGLPATFELLPKAIDLLVP
jgi:diacylglycerol kinase family enzyme